jgi:hypothetical protein
VVDVSNPAAPVIVGRAATPDYARGVAVAGTVAYVANSVGGLEVVDLSSPDAPTVRGSVDTPGNGYGAAAVGSHAFVADRLSGLEILSIQCEPMVGVAETVSPTSPAVLLASPNPFRRAARIRLVRLGEGPLRVDIHDASGRAVRRFAPQTLDPGDPGVLRWDGRDDAGRALPAGVYLVRESAVDGTTAEGRAVLIR